MLRLRAAESGPPAPEPLTSSDEVRFWSSAGAYPPTAHALGGLATLLPIGPAGLSLARLLHALPVAGLLVASLALAARNGSRLRVASVGLAITSTLWFVASTLNPSGWMMAGAVATVVGLASVATRGTDEGDAAAAWLVAGGACAMLLSRTDGLLWAGLVIASAPLMGLRRAHLRAAPKGAIGVVIASAVVAAGSRAVAGADLISEAVEPIRRREIVGRVIGDAPRHVEETVTGLGWLDVPVDGWVTASWVVAAAALIGAAVWRRDRSALTVVAAAIAAFVFVPVAATLWRHDVAGFFWQGRYSFPVLALAVIAAGWGIAPSRALSDSVERRLAGAVVVATVVVWNAAFMMAMRRWSGVDDSSVFPWDWARWDAPISPIVGLSMHLVGTVLLVTTTIATLIADVGGATEVSADAERSAA